MGISKILTKLKEAQIFDIAKILHYSFSDVPTKKIYEIILVVDSVDIAIDILFLAKDDVSKINELVYSVLHYRDNK